MTSTFGHEMFVESENKMAERRRNKKNKNNKSVKSSGLTDGRIRILHVTGIETPLTSFLRIYRGGGGGGGGAKATVYIHIWSIFNLT